MDGEGRGDDVKFNMSQHIKSRMDAYLTTFLTASEQNLSDPAMTLCAEASPRAAATRTSNP